MFQISFNQIYSGRSNKFLSVYGIISAVNHPLLPLHLVGGGKIQRAKIQKKVQYLGKLHYLPHRLKLTFFLMEQRHRVGLCHYSDTHYLLHNFSIFSPLCNLKKLTVTTFFRYLLHIQIQLFLSFFVEYIDIIFF